MPRPVPPRRYDRSGEPNPQGHFYKRRAPGGRRRTELYHIPERTHFPGRRGRRFRGRLLPQWLRREGGEWLAVTPDGGLVDPEVANAAARAWQKRQAFDPDLEPYSKAAFAHLARSVLDALWKGETAGGTLSPEDEAAFYTFLHLVGPLTMDKYRRLVDYVLNLLLLPAGEVEV